MREQEWESKDDIIGVETLSKILDWRTAVLYIIWRWQDARSWKRDEEKEKSFYRCRSDGARGDVLTRRKTFKQSFSKG